MRHSKRWWIVALGGLVAVSIGCGGSDKSGDQKGNDGKGSGQSVEGDANEPTAENSDVPKPPPKPTIAPVQLDTALAKTCLLREGQPIPEGQLPDLAGKVQPIRDLFGKEVTVLVFWNKASMQAIQQLQDLDKDVVQPFSGKGVAVITVNVGNAPDEVRQALELAGAKVPVLLDADGSYFAKVATERFPRTYVSGKDGTVRWFDAEYSESTRRNMTETIEAILLETAAP